MASSANSKAIAKDQRTNIAALLSTQSFDPDLSLSNQIVTELSRLIETIAIQPGELISENEVALALGISKTPVREALIRLEEIKFVKIVPRVGSYVTKIDMDRYIEACFIRLELEIGAVKAAAKCSTAKQKAARFNPLIAKQKKALKNEKHADFYQLDQALHAMFFDIAGVPGVWDTIKRTQTDVNRIRHLKRMFGISRSAEIIKEHQAIVDAICTGDEMAAEQALIAHIGSLDREINTLAAHTELMAYIDTLNAAQPRRRERQAL